MSTKSHIHEIYGTLERTSFCTKGYAEIHIQRLFFDNKNSVRKKIGLKIHIQRPFLTIKIAYKKKLGQKSEWWKHVLVHPLHEQIFIFKKH
jgi:hypothetical protein